MELIWTVSSTRGRLVDDDPAVSPRSWEQILGATLVLLPTERSDKRSPSIKKRCWQSPAGAPHVWAELARLTTRKVPRGGAWGGRTAAPVASTEGPSSRSVGGASTYRQRAEDFGFRHVTKTDPGAASFLPALSIHLNYDLRRRKCCRNHGRCRRGPCPQHCQSCADA